MKKRAHSDFADNADLQIFTLRSQRVILDTDLAKLYGVPTKAFNQAIKRNKKRFPPDFVFQLTPSELANLRSQIVTSSRETNWSQSVTSVLSD